MNRWLPKLGRHMLSPVMTGVTQIGQTTSQLRTTLRAHMRQAIDAVVGYDWTSSLQACQLTQEYEDAQGQVDTEALELLFGFMMCTHICLTLACSFLVRSPAPATILQQKQQDAYKKASIISGVLGRWRALVSGS